MTTLSKEIIIPADSIVLPAPHKLVFEEFYYKVSVSITDDRTAYLYLSKSDLEALKKQTNG